MGNSAMKVNRGTKVTDSWVMKANRATKAGARIILEP